MPGITIHLASANRYLLNHPEEDAKEFIDGVIAPDIVNDSVRSHHSLPDFKKGDAFTYLMGKVQIKECLSDFSIDTSFGRGYFFHLIADDEFYRNILGKNKTRYRNMSFEELSKQLSNDYNVTSAFLKRKYNVSYPLSVSCYDTEIAGEPRLLSLEEYSAFIEKLGKIDLLDYYSTVKNCR